MKIMETTNAVKIEIFAPIAQPIHEAMNVRPVLRIHFTVGSLERGSVKDPHFHRTPDGAAGARTSWPCHRGLLASSSPFTPRAPWVTLPLL